MSEFEEYYKSSKWFGTYESDLMMKDAYLAGQQSQQAKIDELKMSNHHLSVQLVDSNAHYDHVKKERDELQARVDEAIVQINLYYDSNGMEDIVLSGISEILKGEK
jgi:hypothetical protein